MFALRLAVAASSFFLCIDAAQWAVIVAGSNGYENYRHQADACHAYQIARRGGIHPDNIIMMAYDDIAHSDENPFPGKIFNKPDPTGPGVDVYDGCMIDYKKQQVNVETFLNVLTGTGNGKVLKSTAEDHVFINFVDHGGPGLICFPEGAELHKDQLQKTLKTMQTTHMFKRLVFYLESCESGSMFQGMDIPGIYALSASNPEESSWGAYCPDDQGSDKVNGKHLQTCLGDLFSVNWMQDDAAEDTSIETLTKQFGIVVQRTTIKSHVMQWGDKSFTSDVVSEYVGNATGFLTNTLELHHDSSAVAADNIDLHRVYVGYQRAKTSAERFKWSDALQKELAKQQAAEDVYRTIAEAAYPGDEAKQQEARRALEPPDHPECELATHAAIRVHCATQFDANSAFALRFHQVIVNICADVARGLKLVVPALAETACTRTTVVV